jgi:hypothetical protein
MIFNKSITTNKFISEMEGERRVPIIVTVSEISGVSSINIWNLKTGIKLNTIKHEG